MTVTPRLSSVGRALASVGVAGVGVPVWKEPGVPSGVRSTATLLGGRALARPAASRSLPVLVSPRGWSSWL